jgi:hypothetical protein
MCVFEMRQPLLLQVHAVDNGNLELNSQDFIGKVQLDLSQNISSLDVIEIELKHPSQRDFRGSLMIAHEEVENCSSIVHCEFKGIHLKRLRLFFGNNPFFRHREIVRSWKILSGFSIGSRSANVMQTI